MSFSAIARLTSPCLALALLCAGLTVDAADLPSLPPLTTVRQVRELSREDAAEHRPVKLHGVITYYEPVRFLAFLQDETGGIYISAQDLQMSAGTRVEVTGYSAPGMFARCVEGRDGARAAVTVLGRGELPAAKSASTEHLCDETYDAEWIAVSGTVSSVRQIGGRANIEIATAAGPFLAIIPGYYERDRIPAHLEGLMVTARGVMGILRDKATPSAPIVTQLYVPSIDQIVIDPASLAERLQAPTPAYRDLIAPGRFQSQIVRATGQVTLLDPGRGFFMDMSDAVDWKRSLWVNTSDTHDLELGQWVNAVGQADVVSFEPALRDALIQRLPRDQEPPPTRMGAEHLASVDCHGKLVQIEATLLDSQPTVDEDIWVFSAGSSMGFAKLPTRAGHLPKLEKGSKVRVCGIALLHRAPGFELPPKPFAYQIWMRKTSDGKLLAAPSWWNARHVQWVLVAAACLTGAVVIWNSLLRRKVRMQTEIIRGHLDAETIHRERARIARDLHDEIGSNLGSLTLLTQIAEEEFRGDENARREFGEMHRIARKTYDSLRDIVWLTASDSPDPRVLEQRLRETAEMMLASVPHTVSLDLAELPRDLPLDFARHVLLIFKEALHNAVRHAEATLIHVSALASSARLQLRIQDNGRGFDPATVTESAGLPSVRERAHVLQAQLQIVTSPGQGTEFLLDAPILAPS